MPPDDHWMPQLRAAANSPALVGEPGPELVALPRSAEAIPVEVSVKLEKEAPVARGWRFVPERDANNLIIEIVATPI